MILMIKLGNFFFLGGEEGNLFKVCCLEFLNYHITVLISCKMMQLLLKTKRNLEMTLFPQVQMKNAFLFCICYSILRISVSKYDITVLSANSLVVTGFYLINSVPFRSTQFLIISIIHYSLSLII